ncbi:MAG: HD domain-containing protein [Gammaproteobacteria bacterium]|nr:HD domain-containing protein [Gammaproteobacteria bacterium]MBT7230350.1 HD domain-containing protein [Gammaproteobacteria bacterium]
MSETDHHLVQIMVNQCTSALQNINLYQDLNAANRQAVRMLAIAAEFRDKETGDHINRIQQGTYQVALKLGLPEEIAEEYGVASILHDIGKVALPDSILLKPGALTPQEFEIIKQHTTFGVNILNNSDWFELAQEIALSHHERWDGSGYPRGIQGEEIHLAARIVAVVDVFDALVHQRVYKSAWGKRDALSELQSNSGTHFDPRAVNTFIELIESEALYAALPW